MASDWGRLTRLTGGAKIEVERIRLVEDDVAVEGRFELPVAVFALLWLAVGLSVLVLPSESFVPVVIVAGLIVAGAVFFFGLLAFRREALEEEPGDDPFEIR